MNPLEEFEEQNARDIREIAADEELHELTNRWLIHSCRHRYSYHFRWMGRPIIQYPQDILAMQELIWEIQPDLIIETGIAHGGSLVFYASMLELLGGDRQVVGIDVDIRPHNRDQIENHAMHKRITMIEGSSIDDSVLEQVGKFASERKCVMVVLDSMHSHDHVLAELQLYSPFVTPGSYLTVMDTIVENMPEDAFPNRPWGRGNNPKSAVLEFLEDNNRFVADSQLDHKLLISVAPGGYLKCVKA